MSQFESPSEAPVVATPALPAGRHGLKYDLLMLLRSLRVGLMLVFLRRVPPASLHASPDVFAALAGVHLLMLVVLGVATVGINGEFNVYEIPRALFFVATTLLFGLIVARVSGKNAALLPVAVAVVAAGVVYSVLWGSWGVLMLSLPRSALGGGPWHYLYYAAIGWWFLIVIAVVLQFAAAGLRRNVMNALAGGLLLVAPMVWYPQNYLWTPKYDADAGAAAQWNGIDERAFYAQQGLLTKSLAALQTGRAGVADLYLLAAGMYGREDVFAKEVRLIEKLFAQRFDAAGRSVVLLNNPRTLDTYPLASRTSVAAALRRIGGVMNRDEDLLVLYLTSHGSESHQLSVDLWPLRLDTIDPPALKQALDASGIKWRVIVISACYSGGFVKPLQDEHTLIITASSAERQSFGCGSASDATYLAQALFDEELRKTYSFEEAFGRASKSIAERESAQGFLPSQPQLFVGAAVRAKLAEVERRLAKAEK